MSEAIPKQNLKAGVSVLVLIYIIALVTYLVGTNRIQVSGQIDGGMFAGFIITIATAALIKWLFGD